MRNNQSQHTRVAVTAVDVYSQRERAQGRLVPCEAQFSIRCVNIEKPCQFKSFASFMITDVEISCPILHDFAFKPILVETINN